jgi:hypothetical protein
MIVNELCNYIENKKSNFKLFIPKELKLTVTLGGMRIIELIANNMIKNLSFFRGSSF